jgi:hypothetical protein
MSPLQQIARSSLPRVMLTDALACSPLPPRQLVLFPSSPPPRHSPIQLPSPVELHHVVIGVVPTPTRPQSRVILRAPPIRSARIPPRSRLPHRQPAVLAPRPLRGLVASLYNGLLTAPSQPRGNTTHPRAHVTRHRRVSEVEDLSSWRLTPTRTFDPSFLWETRRPQAAPVAENRQRQVRHPPERTARHTHRACIQVDTRVTHLCALAHPPVLPSRCVLVPRGRRVRPAERALRQ